MRINLGLWMLLSVLVLTPSVTWALSGSGTSGDPYTIASRADFDEFCANSAYWLSGVCTRLDVDINLAGTVYEQSPIAPDTDPEAFGFDGQEFEGWFNGNGHKIIGLTISSYNKDYVALFGQIYRGTVEKLAVVDCRIIPTSSSRTEYAAAICADLIWGTISQCYSTGYLSGGYYVGGLCGHSWGYIDNCYSLAVTKGVDYVGGLLGYAASYTTTNCYSAGEVYGLGDKGGLVGKIIWEPTFVSCFWDMETSTQATSFAGTGLTNDQMRTQASFTGAGWDFVGETDNGTADIWKMSHAAGDTNGYPMFTWQTDNPDYSLTGSGTSTDPFVIDSRADFDAVCANSRFWNDHLRLDVNLDLSGTTFTQAPIAPDTVIGPYDYKEDFEGIPFAGHFDGNGHSISGLTISGGDNCHLGLFGGIRLGEVKNLTIHECNISGALRNIGGLCGARLIGIISNCSVTGTISGGAAGSRNIGGLCGYVRSRNDILNCSADVTVSGNKCVGGLIGEHNLDGMGRIMNCTSSGSVEGDAQAGGLCGSNYTRIYDCSSDAAVTGRTNVGGFCGFTAGGGPFELTVSGCYAAGDVTSTGEKVGGFCGVNEGTLQDCFTTSTVTGGTGYVGGFCGWSWNGQILRSYAAGTLTVDPDVLTAAGFCGVNSDAPGFTGSLSHCFWNTQTSGTTLAYTDTSGAYGSEIGVCVGITTSQMQQQATFTDAGWDFVGETDNGTDDIWKMPQFGANNNYPILAWYSELPFSGSGTSTDPYVISSREQFDAYCSDSMFWNAYVRLDCHLDLSDTTYTAAPIAPDTDSATNDFQGTAFTGNFNGNRHRITGLHITGGSNDYLGLFGRVGTGGTVRNLYVRQSQISGSEYTGGICGYNLGAIEYCSASGTITGGSITGGITGTNDGSIARCVSNCTISGGRYVGGVVGVNNADGSIANSYSTGNCLATHTYAGGFAGRNNGSITKCYTTSPLQASVDPYGAFCGGSSGSILNSYYLSGSMKDLYAAGLTAHQFVDQSSFVGWDFTGSPLDGKLDIWKMPFHINQCRPVLSWQIDLTDIISHWLEDYPNCDYNGDGIVNMIDYALFQNDQ